VRERSGSRELPTARASRQRARDYASSPQHPDFHCSMEGQVPGNFFVRVALAGIEPVGFRVKSDLRNHCAIVQPRLYDSAVVTQITLMCIMMSLGDWR
jgi:hypothetical protein